MLVIRSNHFLFAKYCILGGFGVDYYVADEQEQSTGT